MMALSIVVVHSTTIIPTYFSEIWIDNILNYWDYNNVKEFLLKEINHIMKSWSCKVRLQRVETVIL